MPAVNKFTIHILAAVAEHEREMISQHTKMALRAAKERGTTLGNPQNLNDIAAAKGRAMGVDSRKFKADEFASKVVPMIQELDCQGFSLNQIAKESNHRNILTARGKVGAWTPTAVKNAITRVALNIS